MHGTVSQEVIAEEPMLFSASPEFASTYGGPLTAAALARMTPFMLDHALPRRHWVIDTRSHMLMPGQYPAIGGWHCDGVPRAGYDGQPDVTKMRDDVWSIVVHLSTDPIGVSRTRFLTSNVDADVDPGGVWASVHEQVGSPAGTDCATRTYPDGTFVAFTMPTLHRAQPALVRGWRWWMRASCYSTMPVNKIRRQAQVYTVAEGAGW